jgi:hypothetical protein
MLAALGGESETVIVVRESHWAVGWVEWIAVHASDTRALEECDRLLARLENYPVLDEDDFSEREWNAAAEYWDAASPRERVRLAMEQRAQYHWLASEPVWFYGRMDYATLAQCDTTIANALCEMLRE